VFKSQKEDYFALNGMYVKIEVGKIQPTKQQKNASIAQLGERQTEDLKALCSIHSRGIYSPFVMMRHYCLNLLLFYEGTPYPPIILAIY
jgi:hypothetical protein